MIPHHQVAVDMSKKLLKYTENDMMIFLAYRIIRSQQNEIVLLNDLLKNNKLAELQQMAEELNINIHKENNKHSDFNITITKMRPPIFWKDKPIYLNLLKKWHISNVLEALTYLGK